MLIQRCGHVRRFKVGRMLDPNKPLEVEEEEEEVEEEELEEEGEEEQSVDCVFPMTPCLVARDELEHEA